MALVHLNLFLRLVLLGMIWSGALSPDVCANPLSIIALVGNHDGAPFETNEQCLSAHEVMDLAQKDQEAERATLRLDPCVDFCREASLVSVDTTISTLFDARGVLMDAPDQSVDHCLSPLDLRLHPGAVAGRAEGEHRHGVMPMPARSGDRRDWPTSVKIDCWSAALERLRRVSSVLRASSIMEMLAPLVQCTI